MAVIDTLSLLLTANSEPMRKELDKAGKSVQGFKKQFGEESSFGMFGKLLKGGGVVGGLTLAFAGVEKLITGFDDLDRRVQAAGGSWRDYVREIGKSIPVVSQTVNILNALTGELKRNRDQAAYAADVSATASALEEFHRQTGAATNTLAELINENERALKLGSVFGVDREALQIAMDAEAQLKRIAEQHAKVSIASKKLLDAQKAIFAFMSATGGATAEQLAEQQQRMLQAITAAATEGVDKLRLQKLGNVLSTVAADSVAGGIETGFDLAAQELKKRKLFDSVVQGALTGLRTGIESGMVEPQDRQARFAGLDPAGSGAQLLAMELSRQQLESPADKLPAVVEQIRQTIASIKVQLER